MGNKTGPTPKKLSPSKAWKARVREKSIEYYLQGKTNLHEVAARISAEEPRTCSYGMVYTCLRQAMTEWDTANKERITEYKHEEIARIDALQAVAWDAWLRSCDPERTVTRRKTPIVAQPGKRSNKKTPQFLLNEEIETEKLTAGNKKFLDTVQWCITKRLEVMASMSIPLADADKPGQITNNTTIRQIVFSGKASNSSPQVITIND